MNELKHSKFQKFEYRHYYKVLTWEELQEEYDYNSQYDYISQSSILSKDYRFLRTMEHFVGSVYPGNNRDYLIVKQPDGKEYTIKPWMCEEVPVTEYYSEECPVYDTQFKYDYMYRVLTWKELKQRFYYNPKISPDIVGVNKPNCESGEGCFTKMMRSLSNMEIQGNWSNWRVEKVSDEENYPGDTTHAVVVYPWMCERLAGTPVNRHFLNIVELFEQECPGNYFEMFSPSGERLDISELKQGAFTQNKWLYSTVTCEQCTRYMHLCQLVSASYLCILSENFI